MIDMLAVHEARAGRRVELARAWNRLTRELGGKPLDGDWLEFRGEHVHEDDLYWFYKTYEHGYPEANWTPDVDDEEQEPEPTYEMGLWIPDLDLAEADDTPRIGALEWTKGDVTICPPGNHGGEVGNWLIAFEDESRDDGYGKWSRSFEAPTLREAIDSALQGGID